MTKESRDENVLLLDRRGLLSTIGAFGSLVLLTRCGSGGSVDAGDSGGTDGGSVTDAAVTGDAGGTCHEIANETSGPYPDTLSMISSTTYDRANIKEDRTGTPLTFTITVVDPGNACAPIVGARVMIWHCDKDGVYSEYSNSMNAGSTTTTYLRGWQTTDANGQVTFSTIYPGWYNPRATHIHIEVYNPNALTTARKVTQAGFPDDVNAAVYAQRSLYTKGQNSSTDDTDQVFGGTVSATGDGDGGGHVYQIATVAGDTTNGYTATIEVGVSSYT